MAADCATRLPHPRPDRAATVGPRLFIRLEKSLRISPLTSTSRGHYANCGRGW